MFFFQIHPIIETRASRHEPNRPGRNTINIMKYKRKLAQGRLAVFNVVENVVGVFSELVLAQRSITMMRQTNRPSE